MHKIMISKKLKESIVDKKNNWRLFSNRESSWSFYQEQLTYLMNKYPNGFLKRESIIQILPEDPLDEQFWDFFIAIMIWGGRDEKNFNKYKDQKDEIIQLVKETYKLLVKNLDINCEGFKVIFEKWKKIKGIDVSFYTKVFYFTGLKIKSKFKEGKIRPLIYDSVMTKHLAYIFLDYLCNDTQNENKGELYSFYKRTFDLRNFQLTKNNSIKLMNPSKEYDDYVKYCEYFTNLSDYLGIDLDFLDEIIFGVNDDDDNNFRKFILNDQVRLNNLIQLNKNLINFKKYVKI